MKNDILNEPINKYIIAGGANGKKRLAILSETLYPYVISHFKDLGVTEGKTFLDVGCGGGNVTTLVSEMVGPGGNVVGIDFDEEIIALNKQDLIKSGITNVTYEVKDVYNISYTDKFDFVYARFILSHLEFPMKVLQRMAQSTKPGGKVMVWDIHFSAQLCYPACAAFDSYVELYMKAALNNGHDAEIGPSLYSMFIEAGFKKIGFDVIFPCFHEGTGKWMAHVTLDRIKGTLIEQGLAGEQQVNNLLDELEIFTRDETTIISMPHIFRVWGEVE